MTQPETMENTDNQERPAETVNWCHIQFRQHEPIYAAAGRITGLKMGEIVMVQTEKGAEPAWVKSSSQPVPPEANDKSLASFTLIRRGSREENEKFQRLIEREHEAFVLCEQHIARHGLAMKLIKVERFFNGSKIIFFFTSENRVDFRELVKDLVQEFRTRVEIRQVGVRHETKMIGGLGCCGRELCCSSFIKTFAPVSIKMAKEQNLSLNPTKISGLCNRLLCCLTYEYDTYHAIRKHMPKLGKTIMIDGVACKVIQNNVLEETVVVINPEDPKVHRVLTRPEWENIEPAARPQKKRPPPPRRPKTGAERPRGGVMSLYITTPIFYVNAQPHLGHAYSTLVADVVCRYRRLRGETVFFQTGTDEHGDKIVAAAEKGGLEPKAYTDQISAMFRQAWPPLDIAPDHFIRTTDPEHIRTVQAVLQKVYDQGNIYFSDYTGLYCQGCERFLTEKELIDGKCPDHHTQPQLMAEQNYFFHMGKFQEWLIRHIQEHPEFITPERYRNEVLSFLKEPLEDLCISRPKERLTWGIPLPFDDRFVTYVWFDALINYITGIGYPTGPDFEARWATAEHVIAKDILKPHAIFWPTMLKALGLPVYKRLHVHGYWNMGEAKMSKSLGNVVGPLEMVAQFGVDTVRYFLMREMVFGLDTAFTVEAMAARRNSDLANDLGNLFSRSLTMVQNFASSKVPTTGEALAQDQELADATLTMLSDYTAAMDGFAFHRALQAVWEVISRANRYIVTNAPWELAKEPANGERLATVLYHLLETLRLVTLVLTPIMPSAAAQMAAALHLETRPDMASQGRWGLLMAGTPVAMLPNLFPRLKTDKAAKEEPAAAKAQSQAAGPVVPAADDNLLAYEDFQKVELRVATVIAATRLPKSDRLLKLTVQAPEERTVVAGIAEFYSPEEMIGRQVLLVANLKPAKLMGVTSQGMVLAVKHDGRLVLPTVPEPVPPGSRLS